MPCTARVYGSAMQSTDATGGTADPLAYRRPLVDLRTGEPVEDMRPLAHTPAEVAARLSVSERYVRTLISTGELKSVLLANRRMVLADELDAFIEHLKATRERALREAFEAEQQEKAS